MTVTSVKEGKCVTGHYRNGGRQCRPGYRRDSAAVPATVTTAAGALAVGCGGGCLFRFVGVAGGLFLGGALALGYRLEVDLFRWNAVELAAQQLLDRR